jgi:hypothetical protein
MFDSMFPTANLKTIQNPIRWSQHLSKKQIQLAMQQFMEDTGLAWGEIELVKIETPTKAFWQFQKKGGGSGQVYLSLQAYPRLGKKARG